MLRLLCLLAAVASAAVAAPVPKPKEKNEPVDLRKLHDRIAEAVEKENWADTDSKLAEESVAALLSRLCKAADVEERKLPVDFKDLKKVAAEDVKVSIGHALIVCKDLNLTGVGNSVVLSSGTVRMTSISNSIVIARHIRLTSAESSVLIADESAWATGFDDIRDGDCVVVAGERLRATSMTGGFAHVLRPGDGVPPLDYGRTEDKPIIMTGASRVRFFGKEEKLKFADKDCKWVELKSPIAK